MQTASCSNIQIGVPIKFQVEVTLQSCDLTPIILPITLQGLNEKMIMNIYGKCSCPCEEIETLGNNFRRCLIIDITVYKMVFPDSSETKCHCM